MWALPDIQRLNAEARENVSAIEYICNHGVTPDGEIILCQYHGENGDCRGPVRVEPYFDIFSNDPKGFVALCQYHEDYEGSVPEGFFYCDDCGKVYISNYTWEIYSQADEDGTLCLNCWRTRYLDDPEHWIDLTKEIEPVEFEQLRHAPHLLAVGQSVPDNLKFLGNTEFDSLDGHCISGGENELTELLEKAKAEGYKRAMLILDAGWQFAVSIGAYAETKQGV